MRPRYWLVFVVSALWLANLSGCAPKAQQAGQGTAEPALRVAVSILPQQYFAERIGGEYVSVVTMVPPGAEPHTYEPRPEQLRRLSEVDAYLRIHIDFEDAWMERLVAANPQMRVVDTTEGIERLPLADLAVPVEGIPSGAPSSSGESAQEGLDPHIWLSPRLVKQQARTIHQAFVELDPAHQADYDRNLQAFEADIDTLITDIEATLAGATQRKFLVFHPAWGYFAHDFGLEMISIEVGGQEPSAAELAAVIREAQKDDIHVVFAQPQFSRAAADTIAKEIGGEVLLLDDLALGWLDNMRRMADTLARVLGGKP